MRVAKTCSLFWNSWTRAVWTTRFLSLRTLVSFQYTIGTWVKMLAGTYSIMWSKVCTRCTKKICCTETSSLTMCLSAATDMWSSATLVSQYFYLMNKLIVIPSKALRTTWHLRFRKRLGMQSPLTYGRLACLHTNFLRMIFPSEEVLATLLTCPHLIYQRDDSHMSINFSS